MPECIRVGIVVVSWEQLELSKACLRSIVDLNTREAALELEILVAISDNGSSITTRDSLRTWLSEVADSRLKLIENRHNGGFAYGVNEGIRYLREVTDPRYIWVLNNDLEVGNESLLALVKAAEARDDILMWGSSIVDIDDRQTLQCAGGYRYFPLTTRNRACHAGRQVTEVKNLVQPAMDYVCGASMFCRTRMFDAYGLFNERYFLYFEEQDLVRRFPQPPAINWCAPSIVYHHGAASTSGEVGKRSAMQQYYENLNTLRFTATFFPAYLPWVFLTRLLVKPLLFLIRGEWHLYRPWLAAYAAFIFESEKPAGPHLPANE